MFAALRSLRSVERRAQRIQNPVERLRYLRQTARTPPERKRAGRVPWRVIRSAAAILAATLVSAAALQSPAAKSDPAIPVEPTPVPPSIGSAVQKPLPKVWLAESNTDHEIYSNGLRVETAHTVRNEPRAPLRLDLDADELDQGDAPPAGIVYHSTESHIAPFEASENQRLRRAGESVLDYVRRNRSYHYLIDRFGRVHRVVDERDAAWHAGASIWGDSRQVWLNLNHSFLGVSLEAATADGHGDRNPVTPAQLHALRNLTEMLRSRHSIPAENCVVHAQVSVNAGLRRLGYHTDWASGFPYTGIGLPNNYEAPLASMTVFGFAYDADFLSAGAAAWTGLALSEQQVRRQAAQAAAPVPSYRGELNQRYRNAMARALRVKENAP
jgi:hypothetical protein